MSLETPKIVLLGKSKSKHPEMQKMLKEIQASLVPYNFLDSVYITVADEEKYKIQKSYLKDGIDYKNIEDSLVQLGITREVHLIEVVIDLDRAFSCLQEETAELLDGLFVNEKG